MKKIDKLQLNRCMKSFENYLNKWDEIKGNEREKMIKEKATSIEVYSSVCIERQTV